MGRNSILSAPKEQTRSSIARSMASRWTGLCVFWRVTSDRFPLSWSREQHRILAPYGDFTWPSPNASARPSASGSCTTRAFPTRVDRTQLSKPSKSGLEHFDGFHQALSHTIERVVQLRDFILPVNAKFGHIQVSQTQLVGDGRQTVNRPGHQHDQHRVDRQEHDHENRRQRSHKYRKYVSGPLNG